MVPMGFCVSAEDFHGAEIMSSSLRRWKQAQKCVWLNTEFSFILSKSYCWFFNLYYVSLPQHIQTEGQIINTFSEFIYIPNQNGQYCTI